MSIALEEARKAFRKGEVPIGAVVVIEEKIVAAAHNRCEELQDPTAHAEILAIREACAKVGSYRLDGATIYVTVEPCIMCAGAVILSRAERLVYGCPDYKWGGMGSLYSLHHDQRLNHQLEVKGGILGSECSELMSFFFKLLRGVKKGSSWERSERWPSLA